MRLFLKLLVTSVLIFVGFASNSQASQNLNHLSCVYSFDGSNWHMWLQQSHSFPFNLKPGESKLLSEAWTQDKPTGLNYAFCDSMTGTASDAEVTITTYKYQANQIQGPSANGNCGFTGQDVRLISADAMTVSRGSYAELEIEWIPPRAEKLRVREYFPLESEIPNLSQIRAAKCVELSPQ